MAGDWVMNAELLGALRARAIEVGLAAMGVTSAEPMDDVREVLEDRRRRGLDGGMQFTYRNPQRSTDPQRALPGARSLVVAAMGYGEGAAAGARRRGACAPGPALDPAQRSAGSVAASETSGDDISSVPDIKDRPRGAVALYARFDYYSKLRSALGEIAVLLEEAGWRARVLADDNALVDRAAAYKAGLGWFGKNCNILLPDLGSMFVLGSVLTDAPLSTDKPVDDGCGKCARCHSACPTGALVGAGVLDASRCLAWLLQKPGDFPVEFREALGDRLYGCDDCQTVCPVNTRTARSANAASLGGRRSSPGAVAHEPSYQPVSGDAQELDQVDVLDQVDILDLLSAPDADLLARFGRWYIPKRDPRVLRRNALIVLGNTADGRSSKVEAALRRYLGSGDSLLVSHAAWAAQRLGREDLIKSASFDGTAGSGPVDR